MRLVIVGASGMVGGYALRYALENTAVGSVTSIGRKTLGISHPKLTEVVHRDFTDCSSLAETLSGQDAAVFCLGAYTGAVSDAELRKITVDYTVEVGIRRVRGARPVVWARGWVLCSNQPPGECGPEGGLRMRARAIAA